MQSIFVFLKDVYDELIFYPDSEFIEDSAKVPGITNNSIIKAWKILKDNFDLKIPYVEIKKKIPICGGLGGGSSDAACFINSVFDLWGFSIEEKLAKIKLCRELGSDACVFLFKYFKDCQSVYINGTGFSGDISDTNLSFRDRYIVVVNNGSKLSTKEVFRNFKGPFCKENNDIAGVLEKFNNSLQKSAFELMPSLKKVIDDILLTSPLFCGVSGSGSTCFGLYENKNDAKNAKALLKNYPFVEISRI